MVVLDLTVQRFQRYLTIGGSSATMPTNSPELSAAILEAGMADSNCLERLIEVSLLLMERLSRSCMIFPKRSESCLAVSPVTCPLMMLPVIFMIIGLLPPIILPELAEVLYAQTGSYLVATGCRDQAVHIVEVNGRELVENQAAFLFPFFVDLFYKSRDI